MTTFELSRRRRALVALTAAGVLWGLSVPLTKTALGWLDPAWLSAARFLVAAPLLAVAALRVSGALRGAATPRVAVLGAVGFGVVILLQNFGIARTSVSHAALIIGVVPALVAVVAAARGRATAGPLAWAGFATALGGVALIAGTSGQASLHGDLLVLGSAALTALFIEAQSRVLPGRDPTAVTAVQMTAAAAVLLPVALVLEGAPAAAGASAETAAALAALIVAGTLLPFALYAIGQASVPAELAGAFVNLEPLVGGLVGALAFHDPFGPGQTAGTAAIVVGIVLSTVTTGGRRRSLGDDLDVELDVGRLGAVDPLLHVAGEPVQRVERAGRFGDERVALGDDGGPARRRGRRELLGERPGEVARDVDPEVEQPVLQGRRDVLDPLEPRRDLPELVLDDLDEPGQHLVDGLEVRPQGVEVVRRRCHGGRRDAEVEADVRVHAQQQVLHDERPRVVEHGERRLPALRRRRSGAVRVPRV
jgi:drug/metabolite transporter (DMT)-like permease